MIMESPVGFIGVGIMGQGMLRNLATKLGSNLEFVVWNRGQEALQEALATMPKECTINVANEPCEVVRRCKITFCMLSTMDASIAVFEAANGVYAGVTEGKVIVDCATLTPERMIQEASAIAQRGGMFLEAPVSGSKVPAENGQLIFLCGGGLSDGVEASKGDESVFDLVQPALKAMGKSSFFFGPVGQGSRVKLVVNMTMGTMLESLAEGLALCEAANLPTAKVLEVIGLGAMANPMFNGKGPNMINGNFSVHFPLKHAQKDMRFALDLARNLGVCLPTSQAANAEYLRALDTHGDDDFCAVYDIDRRNPGTSSNPPDTIWGAITGYMGGAYSRYKLSLHRYPVYTKSITSCILSIAGEVIASGVKSVITGERMNVDARRVAVFGLYGFLCTGPFLHHWYAFLEHFLAVKMKLSGNKKIIAKLLIDRCIWGPPFVLFTIAFLQYLQTFCSKTTSDAIKKSYVAVLLMNQKVWVPAQAINFACVPLDYQVLFVNAVSIGWNTFLSMSQ
jgi:glyoxylate/succinic semialdehyde reductase